MKTHTLTHWAVMIVAIVAVSYATFYFTKVEAVYSRTVGTISVTQFVPNEGNGSEFVTLQFSGVLGQDSIADLEGWTLHNGDSFQFDLSGVSLTNKDSVRICEEGSLDPSCNYFWSGTDVFVDSDGEMLIIARDGAPVVHIPYLDPFTGETLNGSGDYTDDVYTVGDKITVCEVKKNGNTRLKSTNIKQIIRDFEEGITSQEEVVPSFVYEVNKKLGYHPGINWPEGKESILSNCE